MVRLLHFADLHLGAESYGRFDPETGLSSRLGDFLSSLDKVVKYALDNQVHLVLFAGDAYRTCDPSPTHQREFASRMARLAHAGIPTVLLTGNHDVAPSHGRANAVEIFRTLSVANIYVVSTPRVFTVETKGGPIQIVGMPWLGRSALTSRDEHKNKTIEEIRELILEKANNIVLGQVQELDPALPVVFLAHGSVFGAAYSSERKTMLGQDVVLPASLCTNPAFDYVALGHIHKHQVLHSSPLVVYAGSLERIDFGEEKEEKGFVVAEVGKKNADYQFVPTQARRFLTIDVVAHNKDPMADIAQAISRHDVRDTVVRVSVRVQPELESLIDEKECRRLLKEAFHVAAITREVEHPRRLRLGPDSSIESLTPRDLLAKYLEYKSVPTDRAGKLLAYAERLMAGLD